ncbi:MAG: hypothetical protein KDI44_02365 [Thiothrix sp.]|nr:hypothetical protein [Thiothrix sp.]HPQ94756.1 hypothetical protein [Thiolinea sp.]
MPNLFNFTKTFRRLHKSSLTALLGPDEAQWRDLLLEPMLIVEDAELRIRPYACHWLTS